MSAPTALAGNVFAGSFSLGVKQAGFRVLGQLEHNDYGIGTAKLNFPRLEIRYPEENWSPEDYAGKVDLFFTNPPCAPWSQWGSGKADSWKTDDRTSCVTTLVGAAMIVQPKTFIWESVCGAWTKGREFVDAQARKFFDHGYHVTILLQNNMYLGAPQNRKRFIFFAHKHPLLFPKYTEPMTLRDAIGKVKSPKDQLEEAELGEWESRIWGLADRTRGSLRGAYLNQLPGRFKKKRGRGQTIPSFMATRLEWDKTPGIITYHRCHPDESRHLTMNEKLALHGLPLTWKYTSANVTATEITRAVLTPVGRWLAQGVKRGLKKPALKGAPQYTLLDYRKPTKEVKLVLERP